ncbi:MAG: GNAT family N-acetyltransferase [Lachnospiraceae bacterium]|nr:GNAT family N-acetyltransferase [Lachnospiraceae bacterium]
MSEMTLREATPEDVDLVYKWANDPTVRANAFSTDPIPYDNHVAWYQGRLNNPDCHIYIGMTRENKPVGIIRVEKQREEPEVGMISYSVDAGMRGKGIGTRLLSLVERKLCGTELTTLAGQVKPDNIASRKAFERAGFAESDRKAEYIEYRKALR